MQKRSNSKLIVDTSGEALKKVSVFNMLNPMLLALGGAIGTGRSKRSRKQIIAKGGSEIVVVSLDLKVLFW
jgi:6-phosphofructokinase 2